MPQLNMEEREILSQLHAANWSRAEIAARLGRHRSTIGRELRRNGLADGGYSGVAAEVKATTRRRERPLVRKMERHQLNAEVRSKISQEWSPDQIARRLKREHPDEPEWHVAPETIYTWIQRDPHREHWESHLRRGHQRRKLAEFPGGWRSTGVPRSSTIGNGSATSRVIPSSAAAETRACWSRSWIAKAAICSCPTGPPPGPARKSLACFSRCLPTTATPSRLTTAKNSASMKPCHAAWAFRPSSRTPTAPGNGAPMKIPTVWFASIIPKEPTSPKSPTRTSPTPQNVSTTAPVNVTTTKHPARFSPTNPQADVALEIGRRWDKLGTRLPSKPNLVYVWSKTWYESRTAVVSAEYVQSFKRIELRDEAVPCRTCPARRKEKAGGVGWGSGLDPDYQPGGRGLY